MQLRSTVKKWITCTCKIFNFKNLIRNFARNLFYLSFYIYMCIPICHHFIILVSHYLTSYSLFWKASCICFTYAQSYCSSSSVYYFICLNFWRCDSLNSSYLTTAPIFFIFSITAKNWLGNQVVIGVPPVAFGCLVFAIMYDFVIFQCICLKTFM